MTDLLNFLRPEKHNLTIHTNLEHCEMLDLITVNISEFDIGISKYPLLDRNAGPPHCKHIKFGNIISMATNCAPLLDRNAGPPYYKHIKFGNRNPHGYQQCWHIYFADDDMYEYIIILHVRYLVL